MSKRPHKQLSDAKNNKKDEFYTLLSDVETECNHYVSDFSNKVIYCNCDNPLKSNFFVYFATNFVNFNIKKLIFTCYSNASKLCQLSLWDNDLPEDYNPALPDKAFKIEITGADDIVDILNHPEDYITYLDGDGDFRSPECVKLLKESDIIITNPPFSLFSEFITLVNNYNKKFLVVGNKNGITNKDIFSLFVNNKIWFGYSIPRDFITPDGTYAENMGGLTRWYTNLDVNIHHEPLKLTEKYSVDKYKKYINYDAIEVDRVKDIPIDYKGVMGVPLTFLDKYNPDEFEIIWKSDDIEWAKNKCQFYKPLSTKEQNYYKKLDPTWRQQKAFLLDDMGNPVSVYFRIFIKKK